MSKRKTTPSVTLFPFLAVLVCTMGALILLLLVTTRRIRQQELERLQAETQTKFELEPVSIFVPDSTPVLEPPEVPVPESPPILPLFYDDFEDRLAERLAEIDRLEQRHRRLLADQKQRQDAMRSQAERQLRQLESEQTKLLEEQRQLDAEIERRSLRLAVVQRQKDVDETTSEQVVAQLAEVRRQFQGISLKKTALKEQQDQLEAELQTVQRTPQPVKPKFEVLAYDGASGTSRRPILIECREDGITFAAERITLTPEQLNGFPPESNPLRSGTQALYDYWSSKAEAGEEEPYVLLIVRPRGTIGFYVARKLLEQWDHDFGYELVHSNNEISWPEPDPQAVQVCQTAIDEMISARARIAGRTKTGRLPIATELEYVGSDGNFHLPEIDQINNRRGRTGFGGPSLLPERPVKNRYELGVANAGEDGYAWATRESRPGNESQPSSTMRKPSGDGVDPTNTGQMGDQGQAGTELRRFADTGPSGRVGQKLTKIDEPLTLRPTDDGHAGSFQSRNGSIVPPAPDSSGSATGSGGTEMRTADLNIAERSPDQLSAKGVNRSPASEFRSPSNGSELNSSPLNNGRRSLQMPGTNRTPADSLAPQGNPFAPPANGLQSSPRLARPQRATRPRDGIGIERQTVIHLYSDKITIDEVDDTIRGDLGRTQFQGELTKTLTEYTNGWGDAPAPFFWKPTIKLVIHPGGNQHLLRVKELTQQWNIETHQEFSLD